MSSDTISIRNVVWLESFFLDEKWFSTSKNNKIFINNNVFVRQLSQFRSQVYTTDASNIKFDLKQVEMNRNSWFFNNNLSYLRSVARKCIKQVAYMNQTISNQFFVHVLIKIYSVNNSADNLLQSALFCRSCPS